MRGFEQISPAWQKRLPYILLTLAVFIAYGNVYDGKFVFDDGLIITRNTLLHSWDTFGSLLTASTTEGAHISGGFFRPMQNILYFIIYQIGGETLFGFHFLNVALHAANACLLYTLGCKLKFNPWAALLATLLWAMHPIHTEAITYMSATADPLHVFFCLLGLIVLLPDFAPRRFLIAIPIFILGLLSKETSVVFPMLVAVTMFLACDKKFQPKTYLRTWPLWVIMGIYLVWRMTNTSLDGLQTYQRIYNLPDYYNLKLYSEQPLWRIYTFLATLPAYLELLVWPVGLHMERSFPISADFLLPHVMEGFGLFMLAAGQLIWGRGRRGMALSWGLLWFGAAHAPDTGLLFPVNSLFLEHWMYLPTAGLFLGIGQSIYVILQHPRLHQFKPAVAIAALAASVTLGVCTFVQNNVWHDPVTFYTHMFKFGVISARAHNNLALAYGEQGDYPKAVEEFNKAIAITDTYAETRHNLALSLLNLPDQQAHIPEAIDDLNRALQIDPNFYRAYQALAQIYAFQSNYEKSLGHDDKADELKDKSAAYKRRADELLNGPAP